MIARKNNSKGGFFMSVTFQYFPFDTGPGADSNEDRWYELMQWMRTPGILTNNSSLNPSTGDLAVTANGTLGVQVAIGIAFIQGFYFEQDGGYFAVSVNPNSSGEDRIDLLVLQLDLIDDNIAYLVLEGTPSGSPVAPSPEQDSDYWQLPLAQIYVSNGAATITSGDITDERVISIQGVDSDVTLTSAGGTTLVSSGAGPNLEILGLTAGENVTLTSSAEAITINAILGSNVTLSSAGGDQTLVVDGTGPDLSIYGVEAGANITITPESGYLSFAATGAGSDVTLASAGGDQTLVDDGTGPDMTIYGLTAGSNITITESDGAVTIAASALDVTLASAGGTDTLVVEGTGPDLTIKGLDAGTGITLTPSTDYVTIAATGAEVTLSSAGGVQTLVADGSGPGLEVYGLTEGTNITISETGGAITIAGAATPTLTSAGGTQTLISSGTGPAMDLYGLTAGTGITIGEATGAITITNSSLNTSVALTSAGGTQTLVDSGSGPNLSVYGLTAGKNISISEATGAITIAYPTPYCQVIDTTGTQAWTNGTNADIFYNTNLSDTTGMHSTVSNTDRIVIATTGLYAINLNIQFTATVAGPLYCALYINATTQIANGQVNTGDLVANISCIVPLSATNFITSAINNLSGATATVNYLNAHSPLLSVCYVGTA